MTGKDLLNIRLNGMLDEYLSMLNPEQLIEVATKSSQLERDVRLLNQDEIEPYLDTIQFPSIDSSYLWLLGMGKNIQ